MDRQLATFHNNSVFRMRGTELILIVSIFPFVSTLHAQVAGPADISLPATSTAQPQTDPLPDRPDQEVQTQASDRNLDQNTQSSGQNEGEEFQEGKQEGKQTNRMFWLVPNFSAVSAGARLPPLSTSEKFRIAAKDSITDYSGYTWTGILAAQGLLTNSDPEFGRGAAAYGRYFWHNFVDGVSGTFFTEAIVPTITHEDPRYYTMGHGGFFRRTAYAISRAFVTYKDSGGQTFNWSEVGGNALEAALSNAYYPADDRSVRQTAKNWGVQMESAVLNHVFQEFWPDIRTKIFRRN